MKTVGKCKFFDWATPQEPGGSGSGSGDNSGIVCFVCDNVIFVDLAWAFGDCVSE